MQTRCSFKSAIEKSTKTMREAQEKNHMDPVHLSSRMPLGQLMQRAGTYTHQAGADGSTAPLPSRKIFSLFLGPPSYMTQTSTAREHKSSSHNICASAVAGTIWKSIGNAVQLQFLLAENEKPKIFAL